MSDAETRRAAELVARLIRDNPDADPDVLAAEIVAVLRARSWRHVPSLSTVPADMHTRSAVPPDDYRAARAELAELSEHRAEVTP